MDEKNKARKVRLVSSQCWAELGFVWLLYPQQPSEPFCALEYYHGTFPGAFLSLPLSPNSETKIPADGEESFTSLFPLPASPSSGWGFHL